MPRWEEALFAATGWDPTWQRQLSDRARAVWATMVTALSAIFGAAVFLAWLDAPADRRWMPYALGGGWFVTIAIVQVLVRRQVLRRIDVEADQVAARQIQMRLLPPALPEAPGIRVAAHYAPMREIGGDFYDVVPAGDRRWRIVMADVSGKGTAAALLTANLQALLHFALAGEVPLDRAVDAINAHLVRYVPAGRFVTMFVGVLDLDRRTLQYVNAGHNPPLAVAAGGATLRLAATGLPLGLFEAASYEVAEAGLPPGTSCVFYTDGLTERENRRGEMFGEERTLAALERTAGRPASDVVRAILEDVSRFAGSVEPADDIALLVLESYA